MEQGAAWGEARINFMSTVHNSVSVFEKEDNLISLFDGYGHEHTTSRGLASIDLRYASVPHT